MRLFFYAVAIIVMSPFALVFAVAAKLLRSKHTHELGTAGEHIEDADPGVDVDAQPEE